MPQSRDLLNVILPRISLICDDTQEKKHTGLYYYKNPIILKIGWFISFSLFFF